ncbi:DMT family transporter [Szabonella alba]|uniref:DMT family transporter n=1 Tax=Szabonella alba TaxID=2804194 RepID=A0A8K0V587_9RHOB|nr:DMT family transporter [Szabonella alba]MBL4915667.1 DMT family transporter [Szabonella alba]
MRPLRGIIFKLLSVTLFIMMSALIKYISDEVPPGQAVFFRSFFAIPVILVWLILRRDLKRGLRVTSVFGHVRRGVSGTMAMGLGFAGLAYLPLPEVTALGYAAPLLTVIFAALILGEKVRLFRISTVLLGLAGVLVVLSPRLGFGDSPNDAAAAFGAMLVLGGAVFAALAQIATRALVSTESTSAIVFCFSVTASVISLASLPFGWVVPEPATAAILVLIGLIGGFGQILLTSSYREADASLVAPFDYASILFALAIGYWVFDEVPTVTMLAGAALVILAGVLIIWREHRLGLERARQRKAMTPQG